MAACDHGSMVLTREHFMDIMEVLDKRLNDTGKNWRHVFKARGFYLHRARES